MPAPDSHIHSIRNLIAGDRPAVARIIRDVGNFSPAEIDCALELVDTYLSDPDQKDYRIVVAECEGGDTCGYACWGPTPLTKGTFDLYWIATHPGTQGRGVGRALMHYVENRVGEERGRLLVLETSSKESYGKTVGFYRRLGYQEASRIPDFYDVGDDKLIFVKRFSR
ncbi:MAG: GNAT family N-acetyltransferase [Acidobacteriia bacterium]|nr:GNAT family N-acetyltransferase [Terriglobia bacterium]